MAGTWATLTNPFPGVASGTLLLLTDGRVLCQDCHSGPAGSYGSPNWYALTPDGTGSYVNGTWAQVATGPNSPLYYASAVLADGRVFVAGGEYNGTPTAVDLLAAEIYDPVANTWTVLSTPAGWADIGDAPCSVLADGTVLLGRILGSPPAIYDPVANTWTAVGNTINGRDEEEAWALLPDGSVLKIDCYGHPAAERYVPSLNTWYSAGAPLTDLVNSSLETGPAVLLATGHVLALGATGANGLYTPPGTQTGTGTWANGPTMPLAPGATGPMAAGDAPACLLPNGKVLCTASDYASGSETNPTYFYEYDPGGNSFTLITSPVNSANKPFNGRMVMLPTGQVLYAQGGTTLSVYNPGGSPVAGGVPAISSVPSPVTAGGTFQLSGTTFNGLSQASMYGDDASQATNYPLVTLTSGGTVIYCRTHGHSSMGVAVAGTVTTQVDVPASCPPGAYQLQVIANGIASAASSVTVVAARQVTLINNGAGATPGTPVTAGASGGASGNAYDGNLAASGATLNWDNTYVPQQGGVPIQVATTSSGSAYVSWATSMTAPNAAAALAQAWFRVYCYVPGALSANTTIFAGFQSGGGTCGSVKLTTSGVVEALDSTGTVRVTTAAFPVGTWFRVEGFITGSATAGQLNLVLYDAQDSTTASSAPATATGLNTLGTMTGWRFGQATALANAGPVWIANTALSNSGYAGPVGYGFSPVRAADGGCTTMVAVGAGGGSGGGTPGLVGNTTTVGAYAGATTRAISAGDADAVTGRVMAGSCQKIYYQNTGGSNYNNPGDFPTAFVDGSGRTIQTLVDAGMRVWLCYEPNQTLNTTELANFKTSVQWWLDNHPQGAAGCRFIIYQEQQDASWGFNSNPNAASGAPGGVGYITLANYYADGVGAGGPTGIRSLTDTSGNPAQVVYDVAGSHPSQWVSWCPDGHVDEIAIDYYGNVFTGQYNASNPGTGPGTSDPTGLLRAHADSLGVPFGFGELGSAVIPNTITSANFITYITYIQNVMTTRLAQGKVNSDVMWYNGNASDPNVNTLSGPPGPAAPSSTTNQATISNIGTWSGSQTLVLADASAFNTGGENMFIQTVSGVAVISYTSITSNTLHGCAFVSGDTGNVPSGSFVACWDFISGQVTDYRVPYVTALHDALTTSTSGTLAVGGDVEGFFTSTDGGTTWSVANTGVDGNSWRVCATIAWATVEQNMLYACTGDQGSGGGFLAGAQDADGVWAWFMRSTQVQYAGNSSGAGLPGPADQSRSTGGVLAQTGNTAGLMYTVGYNSGVWRTNASGGYGTSWTSIGLGGGTHYGRCIAVNPSDINQVFCGMYNEGVYQSVNASSAATWALMPGGPQFPEQFVWCSSGNVYCAAGYGGAGKAGYAPGGLWVWNSTAGWSQLDAAGANLSASSYWMSIDGYTDNAGNDQLILGCNHAVKNTSGANAGTNNLMWVTVSGTSGTPTFSPLTNYLPNIADTTIPPEGRTWWHAGSGEVLGKAGLIQPRPVIDKSTVNTSNVTIYSAGSSGFWISAGNTVGASGPVTSTTPLWTLQCDGMPLHVGHNVTVNPNNPSQFGWTSSDWTQFLVTDGVAYNATTTSQGAPPYNPAVSGQNAGEGYAMAYDPLSGLAGNPTGTVYLSTGDKYHNANGQIWSQSLSSGAGGTYQCVSAGGPPFSNSTANPGTSGGQVAYGLAAGRDASNAPYLLAFLQGASGVGGMWRFHGYTINAGTGVVSTSGGAWAHTTSTPISGSSALGTSGGAANIPTNSIAPIVTDPNQAGVHYVFDQATGVWRSTNYGASWTQIWFLTNGDQRAGWIAVNPAVAGGTELWVSAYGGTSGTRGLFKIPNANTVSPGAGHTAPTGTVTISGIATPGGLCFAPNGDVFCLSLDVPSGQFLLTQLMVSEDGGATWVQADNGSIAATASFPSGMACAGNGRIYIANDANIVAYGYPSVQVSTPVAAMVATASMTVAGPGYPLGFFTATATLTATPPGVDVITYLPMSATAVMTIGGAGSAFVLQQVTGASLFDYGCSTVTIVSSAGNTLMVLAGWDLSVATSTGAMPATYVTDSAGNIWYHVATTTSSVAGARCTAWVAPNAAQVEWVSVSMTSFASSLAFTVLELNGQQTLPDGTPAPAGSFMPQYYDLDVYDAAGQSNSATLSLAPGATTDADFAFAVLATGSLPNGTATPSGWTPLDPVVASPTTANIHGFYFGITSPAQQALPALPGPVNPMSLFPYYQIPAQGTNLATSWPLPAAAPVAGIAFAVKTTVYPPYQPNPDFPVVKVEAGFGTIPGDPTQAPPQWTDITNRVIAPAGQSFIKSVAGRQYELAQAEAGTLEIWLDNHDGAFTPGNTASPFSPNVVLGVPLRVTAWWNGVWYPAAYGYCERWPQEWPDLPQWGISKAIFTDAISVMSAVTMDSALDSEVLLDGPWCLFPAGEQYLSFSNGLVPFEGSDFAAAASLGFYSSSDAQGLLAQNYSRINQRTAMYVDGNSAATGGSGPAIAATGQTTSLLGSAGTGFGTSAITAPPTSPNAGPGIIYTDPNMPDPVTGPGVTVSFWVIIAAQTVAASVEPTVFTAYGVPSSYSAAPSLTVKVLNFTGSSLIQVTLADGTTVTAPFAGSGNAQMVMLVLNTSSLSVFINGALAATKGLMPSQTTAWNAVSWGCPTYAYGSAGLGAGNFTMFGLALTGCALPAQRAVAQLATGLYGQQNVDAITRMAQILAWAGLGIPKGGQISFNGAMVNVLQGPAYNLAGTTAADALNQIAVNENSLIAAMPGGSLVFFHQWALFNLSPVAVLGDNPDPAQGQVPYLPGQSWGFDNTYLYNLSAITQQYGPNNLITVTDTDFTSDHQYYPRTALTQTITTMSALDAYSLVQWIIGKYSQPSLRVSTITVDAASNPNAAFPVILSLLQGQVVTVTRSPVGGATITQDTIIEKIGHSIGPTSWQTAIQASPYQPGGRRLATGQPEQQRPGHQCPPLSRSGCSTSGT